MFLCELRYRRQFESLPSFLQAGSAPGHVRSWSRTDINLGYTLFAKFRATRSTIRLGFCSHWTRSFRSAVVGGHDNVLARKGVGRCSLREN